MRLVKHGGRCCGVYQLSGFQVSSYDKDFTIYEIFTQIMENGICFDHNIFTDFNSRALSNRIGYYNYASNEVDPAPLLSEYDYDNLYSDDYGRFVGKHGKNSDHIIEAILVDAQLEDRPDGGDDKTWAQILYEWDFRLVDRFKNANSKNFNNVFHCGRSRPLNNSSFAKINNLKYPTLKDMRGK